MYSYEQIKTDTRVSVDAKMAKSVTFATPLRDFECCFYATPSMKFPSFDAKDECPTEDSTQRASMPVMGLRKLVFPRACNAVTPLSLRSNLVKCFIRELQVLLDGDGTLNLGENKGSRKKKAATQKAPARRELIDVRNFCGVDTKGNASAS